MIKRRFKVGDIIKEDNKSYTVIEVDDEYESYKCRSCTDYGEIDDEWVHFSYAHKYYELVSKNKETSTQERKDNYRTSLEIIKEWCEKNLSTHTDWTGTRVETKHKCSSVEEFAEKLFQYIDDNSWRV